jgi:protein-L-isoaspartate(D-aspartate) O-methyltransferase
MAEIDVEQARFNMIEQQIRTWDVLDQRVLDLMARTPREEYVPAKYRSLAFADTNVPLDHGQEMLPPRVEARLLQALDVRPTDIALEVGTGSGYLTALLAAQAKHVYSVEIFEDVLDAARRRLAAQDVDNVTLEVGDAAAGWPLRGPYDIIAVTGSLPLLPAEFQNSLRIGGRMFVVVGETPVMEARLVTRVSSQDWAVESLFETDIRALVNAQQPQRFLF